jgi:SNF family Na+-dependent transporter
MYSNFEVTCFSSAVGILFFALGLLVGSIYNEASTEKKRKTLEQEEKQQKMWNEYINAVKGGQYGK